MRRTMCMLVVMGTTLALAAGVALAQATTFHEVDTQQTEFFLEEDPENPCVGETIHFTGLIHFTSHTTQDAAGGLHTVTHFNFIDVQGTGLVSGGQYRLPQALNGTIHSNAGGFPIVQTEEVSGQVIGQGQLPDFRSHFLLHITINENGDSTAEVLRVTAQCRNTNQ
jgi:hypothetical protein